MPERMTQETGPLPIRPAAAAFMPARVLRTLLAPGALFAGRRRRSGA